ncbi:MAG: thioredoxin domain-containing protein [Ilumatobacter sp.]|uniref:thioredoxin domain-containing protein n=1 Tax=Ilumatobacter sp. TaxID=1967498 RepID=UPI00391A9232
MERLVIAAVIVIVAVVVAEIVRRRRTPDAPTQRRFNVPQQLDRADFIRPDAPWLVVVFSSDTCDKCAEVRSKAAVLESSEVAVATIDFAADRALHERYQIDAVPTLVVVDHEGVTRASFLGPMSAADLWAAVAGARESGSTSTDSGPATA